jgi:hypothetical protein
MTYKLMHQPLVINIVLNYNRKDDTLACLASLAANTYQNQKTIVLDNGSTDGTVPAIRSAFPDVQVIDLTENRGYAGNNNVGIRAALDQGADWVFVLNEDTILDPECISNLVQIGESDSRIGIVGPMVYHFDTPDIIQSAGGLFDNNLRGYHIAQNAPDKGQFPQPHLVDWISGCAIMVRRAAIEEVGMIDERFFYYVEEAEWCLRTKEAGWKILHVPGAKLWHKGVQLDYKPKPSVTYYATRNRLLLLSKHHAPLKAWLVAWEFILRTLTSWTIRPKWRNMHEHRDAMWRGTMDFLRHRWGQMPD